MSDQVKKATDQTKEGEPRRSTATAKASTENFTAEEQVQPTEKFTTWSGEEPKKVLLAAKQGETLEEFTARTNKYQEEQAQKAKNKPAIQPFCIGGFEDGSEVKAGEKQKPVEATKTKKGHKVADDPHPTRMLPAMTPESEAKIKADKQTKHEQISQSATLMAIEAGKNPAMEPVALTRQYADSLPDGHPKKQPLTELTRAQAAALSPEMRARYKQFDGSTHRAIAPETLTNSPEGWLIVAQKIAQLPMDKQLQVIGSGLMAGIEQYQHDERERAWGQLIGTVQGTSEVLQGVAKIADFGAACILGDNERAGKMGEEFGTALGQTIVGGVRLFQAADQYLFNIGYTGDYAKPFRDIAAAGQKLDAQWSKLPPREQERIKAKLITEMIESGALGVGGASSVQKASKFTEVLDALAVEAKQLHAAAKPTIKKAVTAINDAVDELVQPMGDTGMGVKMPFPKDPLKDETKMLMSKADDLEDGRPRRPEGDVKRDPNTDKFHPSKRFLAELKQAIEGLDVDEREFLKGHNIEIRAVNRISDFVPGKERLGACYSPEHGAILVPEEILRMGKWTPNDDVPFALRHEFGHVLNAKESEQAILQGKYISDKKEFIDAYNRDVANLKPGQFEELQLNTHSKVGARDEIFADMYAHVAWPDGSNNPYSQKLKDAFPNFLKVMEELFK